jgi:hypothetical protein
MAEKPETLRDFYEAKDLSAKCCENSKAHRGLETDAPECSARHLDEAFGLERLRERLTYKWRKTVKHYRFF